MKENLKPCAYKHIEHESESEQGAKLLVYDPKPGDLPMVRLKWK